MRNTNGAAPLDAAALPARVTRASGAVIVSRLYFPVSARSLERWPLAVRRVNGKALIETADLLKVAQAKLAAAPVVACGPVSLAA